MSADVQASARVRSSVIDQARAFALNAALDAGKAIADAGQAIGQQVQQAAQAVADKLPQPPNPLGVIGDVAQGIKDKVSGLLPNPDDINVMDTNVPRAAAAFARGAAVIAANKLEQALPGDTHLDDIFNQPPEVPPFPDPSELPVTPNPTDREYAPSSGQLWPEGGPVPSQDVQQSDFGNCYFMASMAGLSPEAVQNMVHDNGDGTYTVRLYDTDAAGNSSPVFVRVDGDLPTSGSAATDGSQEAIWPAIVEKAYAAHVGGYGNVDGSTNTSYFEAPTVLTGKPTVAYTNQLAGGDVLYDRFEQAVAEGRPIFAGYFATNPGEDGYQVKDGVYGDHAYTVVGVRTDESGQQYVTVRNPWGDTDLGGGFPGEPSTGGVANDGVNDGQFEMTMEEYMRMFHFTAIAGG
ncbi:MAG: hypothetical protein JXR83_02720 [Deltaproteobacteria bacterium]|nr:hypothetical protein [Deltaproteobacteria bacterium]